MSPSRAISFSISVLFLAAAVALAAQSGPDSPRARASAWLRSHGYPEMADVLDPANALPVIEILP